MNNKTSLSAAGGFIVVNIYLAACFLVYKIGGNNSSLAALWTVINPFITGLLASIAAFLAFRTGPAQQRPMWLLLAGGLGLWVCAEGLWAVQTLAGDELPYPSFADVLWLVGYFPIGAAIEMQIRQSRSRLNWIKVAAALALGGGLTVLAGRALVIPMIANFTIGAGFERVLNILYPVLDATLLAGGALAILGSDWRNGWQPWLLIGGALVLWSYSDMGFSILSAARVYGNNWFSAMAVDIPYNLAYLLTGLGCMQAVTVTRRAAVVVAQSVPGAVRH
jgi:hypothetical protein